MVSYISTANLTGKPVFCFILCGIRCFVAIFQIIALNRLFVWRAADSENRPHPGSSISKPIIPSIILPCSVFCIHTVLNYQNNSTRKLFNSFFRNKPVAKRQTSTFSIPKFLQVNIHQKCSTVIKYSAVFSGKVNFSSIMVIATVSSAQVYCQNSFHWIFYEPSHVFSISRNPLSFRISRNIVK